MEHPGWRQGSGVPAHPAPGRAGRSPWQKGAKGAVTHREYLEHAVSPREGQFLMARAQMGPPGPSLAVLDATCPNPPVDVLKLPWPCIATDDPGCKASP